MQPVGPISDRNETVSEETTTEATAASVPASTLTLVQATVESRGSSCPSITFNFTLIIFILLTI